jgi:hypothetical protein
MGMVKVACHHIGGLSIRLFRQGWDDGTGSGIKPIVPVGAPVVLSGPPNRRDSLGTNSSGRVANSFGITEVDEEFMNEWVAQNSGKNPLLDSGVVYVLKDDAAPEPVPADTPQIDPASVQARPKEGRK